MHNQQNQNENIWLTTLNHTNHNVNNKAYYGNTKNLGDLPIIENKHIGGSESENNLCSSSSRTNVKNELKKLAQLSYPISSYAIGKGSGEHQALLLASVT